MNQKENEEMMQDHRISQFMGSLLSLISSKIDEQVNDHDMDSMGSWNEERNMRETLKEIGFGL